MGADEDGVGVNHEIISLLGQVSSRQLQQLLQQPAGAIGPFGLVANVFFCNRQDASFIDEGAVFTSAKGLDSLAWRRYNHDLTDRMLHLLTDTVNDIGKSAKVFLNSWDQDINFDSQFLNSFWPSAFNHMCLGRSARVSDFRDRICFSSFV